VIATDIVTSKAIDQAFPQYSCALRGGLRRAEIAAQAVSQLVQTEATGLFVVFCQGKPRLATFIAPH
jgi:hypothetical protein